jgi:hypothetical protein
MNIEEYKLGIGHWPDSLNDDGTCSEKGETPWESWRLFLHGSEAGDYIQDKKEIELVLLNLGYKLIKIKKV